MQTEDLDPSAGELVLRRGVNAARAGLQSVAAANLERAAELLPDDPNVWLWLAWAANSPDNMRRCLERVLELSPGHAAASAGLIWINALTNDAPKPAVVVTVPEVVKVPEPIAAPVEKVLESPSIESVMEPEPEPTVAPVADLQDDWKTEPMAAPAIVIENTHESTREWAAESAPIEPARRRWSELVQRSSDFRAESNSFVAASQLPPPLPTAPPPLPFVREPVRVESEATAQATVYQPTWKNELPLDEVREHREPESIADVEALANSFSPPAQVAAVDDRPLVMVVDDSPTVRKLVSLTLERRGYRVVSAFDGVAAIKELGLCRPDLILLDINMPRLDGYRLCKLIKKHEATQSIPVVMLSGKDGMFDKLRGRLVGCTDYITKPFEADALTHKVAKYLTVTTSS